MMLVTSLANACVCESCVSELIVRLRNAVAERLGLFVSPSPFVVLRTALQDIHVKERKGWLGARAEAPLKVAEKGGGA